jgi:hypothetical protein
MNTVSSCCSCLPDRFGMPAGNGAYQSAQIENTAIAGEQRTDIFIQTADGDKLTLSSDIKFESTAITYEELGRTSGSFSQSQGQIVSVGAGSQFELTVEGTLDEQEKKEIKAVLMRIFKMVKDFMAGAANTEEAQTFANLTTISEVHAEFDIKTSIASAARSYTNYMAQNPLEEKPAVQEAQTANLSPVPEPVNELTDRMIRFVKDSGIEPSKILKQMNRRLSRRFHKFMNAKLPYWYKMFLREAILEDFAGKLEKLSSENQQMIDNKDRSGAETAADRNASATMETSHTVSETVLNIASQDFHFEMQYSAADGN